MKKYLLLVVVLLLLCGTIPFRATPAAYAEVSTKPHVVINEDIWLYDSNGSKLFLLPNSYYVPISSMDDYYYYVTFNGISGRITKNSVTTTGYHAVAPSTMQELRVSSDYAEFSSILLKKTPDLSADDVSSIPINSTFTYVGSYPVENELWYAVKWEQHFGYVRASRTNCPNITISTFTPEQPPQSDVDDPSEDANQDVPTIEVGENQPAEYDPKSNTLKTILIIGLIIPAVLVIFLIFRPKSKA